ncbi:MAG: hypothetical protein RLZZ592_123 [Pseudomonadota bacterium]|jgi:predicted flap endonuclease-1-like 5' DNA nuclease|nr:hypothetical protein [Pseudomonadota bacterium]
MDTKEELMPTQAGQPMLALMGASVQWWLWMPWAAWLPTSAAAREAADAGAQVPVAAPVEVLAEAPVELPVRRRDDLTRLEGIGPRIAGLLTEAGFDHFAALAAAPVDRLEAILAAAGSRFRLAQPATWPQQAALLAAGDEAGFAALVAELKGGVRR